MYAGETDVKWMCLADAEEDKLFGVEMLALQMLRPREDFNNFVCRMLQKKTTNSTGSSSSSSNRDTLELKPRIAQPPAVSTSTLMGLYCCQSCLPTRESPSSKTTRNSATTCYCHHSQKACKHTCGSQGSKLSSRNTTTSPHPFII